MAYGDALPPSQEARILSLPPAGEPTYDEALLHSVNGDSHKASDSHAQPAASSLLSSFGSSTSVDKVFQNVGVNGGPEFHQPVKHDHTMQRPQSDMKPQPRLSTDELEYDDTGLKQGDKVQQYQRGRQTVGNAF